MSAAVRNTFTGEHVASGRTLAAWDREIRERESALSSDQLELCSREVRGDISQAKAVAAWDALRIEAIALDLEREKIGAASARAAFAGQR